ncbi:MAG: permease [Lysobacterales bacterium CG17_big_fil_post_rev_8_21_14_2_50_64_11]|nr:MAG: permease [Xanthomonadales bacterium CG17_big_fil_post_rev_8_21_14_2_50_64_11]PIX60676.1 MAG: permease [Xanthomonadales bacterium CG_4_10_14_3_um_filter_64_11]
MSKRTHLHPSDLQGLGRLSIEAVTQVTHLVESLHHTITQTPAPLGAARPGATAGITGLVYRSIRGVTALVGGTLEMALARLQPLLRADAPALPSAEREAVLAALNGVLGDHLAASGNPLAITMRLRCDGLVLQPAAVADAGSKIAVLVHGLCMNDRQWGRLRGASDAVRAVDGKRLQPSQSVRAAGCERSSDAAAALLSELGYRVLHLHYNSGCHISHNGREFADTLQMLLAQWPQPVHEIVLIGHSMGGLVARSACHYAAVAGHEWLAKLRAMVFLGSPHHGAALERGGNGLDVVLGASPYTAPLARLGKLRSAGITDLRYGNVRDEDWLGQNRFARTGDRRQPLALPPHVRCFAVAASTGKQSGDLSDRVLGDGLVSVDSALGRHCDPARALAIPESRQWIGYGINHLQLLHQPAVYAQLRRWLED